MYFSLTSFTIIPNLHFPESDISITGQPDILNIDLKIISIINPNKGKKLVSKVLPRQVQARH